MEKKVISNIIEKVAIFLMIISIFLVSFENFIFKTTTIWLTAMLLLVINMLFFKEKVVIKNKEVLLWILTDIVIIILSLFANNFLVALKFIILYSSAIFSFAYLKTRTYLYNTFFKLIIVFSKIFAYFTILSVFFEKIYFSFIHLIFPASKYASVVALYKQGCYSGIAGQTGVNSFLIAIGIIALSTLLFMKEPRNIKVSIYRIYSFFLMFTALLLCNKRTMTLILFLIVLLIAIIGSINKDFTKKLKNVILFIGVMGYSAILLFCFSDTFKLITRSMDYLDNPNKVVDNKEIIDSEKPNINIDDKNNSSDNQRYNEYLILFDSFLNGRSDLYAKAVTYFTEHPLVGIGIDHYTYYEKIQTHNSTLQLLAETGLIGTIVIISVICYFLIYSIINLRKYLESHLFIFAMFSEILILLYSLTGNPFHDFNQRNFYFIALAMIVGITNYSFKEKKNKGIITYHLSQNFGGVLQSYALNKSLNDSELINYYSKPVYDFYNPLYVKKYGKINLINILKTIYQFKNELLKMIAFDNFRNEHLKCSPLIESKKDLINYCKDYQKIITGSDQVWNSVVTKEDADVYFLNFDCNAKKYSYAASIGTSKVTKEQEKEFKDNLKNYSKITVREESAKDILSKLNIDSSVVVDPTLLLNKEDWDKIASKKLFDQDYIFVYGLNRTKEFVDAVNKASKMYNLPVVHVDRKHVYERELASRYYASPSEFIALLRDAKYVVTDSFHCSVFSIIYHKQFISIPHVTRSTRQENLLSKAGLLDHLTNDVNMLSVKYKKVNLDKLRKDSLKFIEELNND